MQTRRLCRLEWTSVLCGLALSCALTVEGIVTIGNADSNDFSPIHVFLVRHAEAQRGAGSDPGLTTKGEGRSHDLARLLSASGVTHLFSSEYQRTQLTLAPLAQERSLEVQVVSARDPESQIQTLRGLDPGSVAVVAGHSNTVPSLVKMLGGSMTDVEDTQHGLMFDESQYDRLVLIVLQPQQNGPSKYVACVEMRYGDGSE